LQVEIYLSQPGLGDILGARVLADDPTRYADARCRKNYAATSPELGVASQERCKRLGTQRR
jgi:hypothetical protein